MFWLSVEKVSSALRSWLFCLWSTPRGLGMRKRPLNDQVEAIDGQSIQPAIDTEIEPKTETDQFLNLSRERVGLINIRHHPKKGNKNDRY